MALHYHLKLRKVKYLGISFGYPFVSLCEQFVFTFLQVIFNFAHSIFYLVMSWVWET